MRPCLALLLAIAASSAPSLAQTPPSTTEQAPIVVEGRRDRDAEIRELVNSLPPAPVDGHISRFEHDACPAVLGLPAPQRAYAVQRMRAVARAGGVPLADPGCRPNVMVMVTPDKGRLIELLARNFPSYLHALSRRQIARLERSPEPTALWHLNNMVDADGLPVSVNLDNIYMVSATRDPSRITDAAHMAFVGSVLIVELRALAGLSTTQFADYAAMRTFTGADPARLPDRRISTILTLVDAPIGSEIPLTLTSWDLAFLESLYGSNVNRDAPSQRDEIREAMSRRLEPADERGRAR